MSHTLAKAVMEFWLSASVSAENVACSQPDKFKLDASLGVNESVQVKDESGGLDKVFVVNLICGLT